MRMIPILLSLLFIMACQTEQKPHTVKYSTTNDSCAYYYNLGWTQIMDEGFYGPAEASYRKALSFDTSFLVGHSVLARLTLSLEERIGLYNYVEKNKVRITGDERKIVEVYQAFTHLTNLRAQNSPKTTVKRKEALALALNNFDHIIHTYDQELYMLSEYIEIIHALKGPAVALDSLYSLQDSTDLKPLFLLGYAASMHAELKDYEKALSLAKQLESQQDNPKIPKSHVVYADIYYQKGALLKAYDYALIANQLDPRNLDASRLLTKIKTDLQKIK